MSIKDEYYCHECRVFVKEKNHALSDICAENQARGNGFQLRTNRVINTVLRSTYPELLTKREYTAEGNFGSFKAKGIPINTNPDHQNWQAHMFDHYGYNYETVIATHRALERANQRLSESVRQNTSNN